MLSARFRALAEVFAMDRALVGWCSVWVLAVGAALGAGCGNSGVDFSSGGANSGSSSSGSGKASASASGSGGATGPASGSSSSSTSAGGCTADPQDDTCVACAKQSCCATLVPCQNDEACVCWTGCLAQNPNNAGACSHCGSYDATTNAFVTCTGDHCLSACGGTTTTSSSSSAASSSSGNPLCAPAMGDSACTACSKANCCGDVVTCAGDQNCLCILGCLAQNKPYQLCSAPMPAGCGAADSAFLTLATCSSTGPCQGKCP
jgi:hypothetical protein